MELKLDLARLRRPAPSSCRGRTALLSDHADFFDIGISGPQRALKLLRPLEANRTRNPTTRRMPLRLTAFGGAPYTAGFAAPCTLRYEEPDLQQLIEKADTLVEALRLDAEDPLIHNDLGVVLYQLGETGRACDSFRRAVQLAPVLTEARDNLRMLEAQ